MPFVVSVIVAYQPEAATFLPLLDLLAVQTGGVIIVDNSARDDDRVMQIVPGHLIESGRLSIVRLGGNFGIATALNVGIEEAVRSGADLILLSDQDSLPATDMVSSLCEAYRDILSRGAKIGAVGPLFTDIHTGRTHPFQAELPGKFFYGHMVPTKEAPHVDALTLITSGMLLPVEVLRTVGLMREDYFIDHVDVEWCHRARAAGYHLYGTGLATMFQRMGDSRIRVWYMGWRYENEYPPVRVYYRIRNFISLCKLSYVDWRWKVRCSWYLLGVAYTHIFFSKRKNFRYLLSTAKGFWHGLTNQMGGVKPQ